MGVLVALLQSMASAHSSGEARGHAGHAKHDQKIFRK